MKEIREKIPVEQLVPGLYVDLDLHWTKHPFLFSRFKIKSQTDVSAIQQLNLKEVYIIPERSDVNVHADVDTQQITDPKKALDALWKNKKASLDQAEVYRKRRTDVAKRYKLQARMVESVTNQLKTEPANAIHNVDGVVDSLVDDFEDENELLTNVINLGGDRHTDYNHAVNVTVLSLMMGVAEKLTSEELRQLCMGALLHDVGKIEVPSNIRMKKSKLSNAEALIMQRHAMLGRELAQSIRYVPQPALEIIEFHHEFLDGSGFPKHFEGEKLSKLVRIVSIANTYDNLCNPPDILNSITPKTVLALMFTKYKGKFDRAIVERFIRTMGVYPPGTVVRLTDGSIALVVTVDPKDLLRPEILLYNPDVPKEQALVLNLKEHADISIEAVLPPSEYPSRIYQYLNIDERIGFFFEKKV